MSLEAGERVVDKEYLALLENKLAALKDPKKATAKQFISDIATYKDQQLFKLITAGSPAQSGFDDDFADVIITPNYLRRIVAPQTCAVNKLELVHLVKSDHVQENNEVLFTERKFLPFSESNQILIIRDSTKNASSSVQTCLINAYGRLHFVEENKIVCLPKLLNESQLKSGHSVELSCSDVSPLDGDGSLAVLATFWVELNEHFCPCRHFGAVFRISSTLHVELTSKVEAATPVAHCSIVNRMEDSKLQKYWIVYEFGEELPVYKMQEGTGQVNRIDHALSVFPELALDAFPGAVTRSSLVCSEKLRWSALGFDTGHVFLSVFAMDTHMVYRKLIKFSGPISVVQFIPFRKQNTPTSCDGEGSGSLTFREERYLVVSSTLGPVAVWKCNFEEDFLSWNHEFVLKQSEQFDTITSACVTRELIAVGTYSGKVLFYSSNCDLLSHEIASITQIHAPVVMMKVLDEATLYVLSTAGLHTVTSNDP